MDNGLQLIDVDSLFSFPSLFLSTVAIESQITVSCNTSGGFSALAFSIVALTLWLQKKQLLQQKKSTNSGQAFILWSSQRLAAFDRCWDDDY